MHPRLDTVWVAKYITGWSENILPVLLAWSLFNQLQNTQTNYGLLGFRLPRFSRSLPGYHKKSATLAETPYLCACGIVPVVSKLALQSDVAHNLWILSNAVRAILHRSIWCICSYKAVAVVDVYHSTGYIIVTAFARVYQIAYDRFRGILRQVGTRRWLLVAKKTWFLSRINKKRSS